LSRINTLFYCHISFLTRHFLPSLTDSRRSSYPPPPATPATARHRPPPPATASPFLSVSQPFFLYALHFSQLYLHFIDSHQLQLNRCMFSSFTLIMFASYFFKSFCFLSIEFPLFVEQIIVFHCF